MDLVCSIRREQPAWSKHKIAVILARDHGVTLSASTVGRVLKRKGLYEKKKAQGSTEARQKGKSGPRGLGFPRRTRP